MPYTSARICEFHSPTSRQPTLVHCGLSNPVARVVNIHPHASGYVIGAGSVLGLSAGLLWTAQGSLMLAYPIESQKGKFIAIFWSIFNLGGVVGAAVSLGQNFDSKVRFCIRLRGLSPRPPPARRLTLVSPLCAPCRPTTVSI